MPCNEKVVQAETDIKGYIGASLPFRFILKSNNQALELFFKGTALGMSWIKYDLLRRNTIISAANEGRKDLIELIEQFQDNNYIGYAAEWAVKKLNDNF